jgi:tripartite-type tricarboxylate transporter receptor subunit TctC
MNSMLSCFRRRANRTLLTFAAATGLTLMITPSAARAQEYPKRPITVVVAQAAGGSSDTVTRMWAEYLTPRLGQPVVVENKPGAGGIVAAQAVLTAPADGHTLYSAGTSSLVLNRFTFKSMPFDPDKDFRGVATLTRFTYLLLANPATNTRTFDDLVRAAKERPGALNYGSAGIGNGTHLFFELLQKQTGTKMTHVPYKGEVPSLTGLMGGEVQVVMSSISASLPNTLAGKLQPLVLLGANRLKELPNVPTSLELGLKGFESLFWAAIVARAGTPDDIVRKLNALTQQFLAEQETQRKLAQMYFEPMPGSPESFDALLAADVRKWTEATRGLDLISQ